MSTSTRSREFWVLARFGKRGASGEGNAAKERRTQRGASESGRGSPIRASTNSNLPTNERREYHERGSRLSWPLLPFPPQSCLRRSRPPDDEPFC